MQHKKAEDQKHRPYFLGLAIKNLERLEIITDCDMFVKALTLPGITLPETVNILLFNELYSISKTRDSNLFAFIHSNFCIGQGIIPLTDISEQTIFTIERRRYVVYI